MTNGMRAGGCGLFHAFTASQMGRALGYTIAAYVIVIGALAAYGLSTYVQRRKLIRRSERNLGATRKI
jgi:hypothetical protein